MANVILGEQQYTELPAEHNFEPRRGYSTTRRFKGSPDAIKLLASEMAASGYAVRMIEGAAYELQATISALSADGDPQNYPEVEETWELQASAGEVDIVRSPLADALPIEDRKLLRDLAKGMAGFEETDSGDFTSGDAVTLFNLMADGMTSQKLFYPTLRNTRTAYNQYIFPSATTGVGQLYSTARLLAGFSIPSSIANNMQASSQVSRSGLLFTYAWLYSHPTIIVSGNNRVQFVREWEWGLWAPTYTYNA